MVLGQAPRRAAQLLDPLGAVVFDVEVDELQSGRTDRRGRGVGIEIAVSALVIPPLISALHGALLAERESAKRHTQRVSARLAPSPQPLDTKG